MAEIGPTDPRAFSSDASALMQGSRFYPIPGWSPTEEGPLHDIIDEASCYAGHRVDEVFVPLVPADVHT